MGSFSRGGDGDAHFVPDADTGSPFFTFVDGAGVTRSARRSKRSIAQVPVDPGDGGGEVDPPAPFNLETSTVSMSYIVGNPVGSLGTGEVAMAFLFGGPAGTLTTSEVSTVAVYGAPLSTITTGSSRTYVITSEEV